MSLAVQNMASKETQCQHTAVPLFSPLADELNASLIAGVTLRKVAIVIRSAKDRSIRS